MLETNRWYCGDVMELLGRMDDESVQCVVTSPPYWGLRDYGVEGQIGLEETVHEFVSKMVDVFSEVRRVLRSDGTLWMNFGDCYHSGDRGGWTGNRNTRTGLLNHHASDGEKPRPNRLPQEGLKDKDLVGMPWRIALALQADGWYLRSDIIWHKPNPMPESVADRPTKAHEYIFLLTKLKRYHYDADAIREPVRYPKDNTVDGLDRAFNYKKSASPEKRQSPSSRRHLPGAGQDGMNTGFKQPQKWNNDAGRNKRTVWTVPTQPFPQAHFATFPEALIEPCIKAGCPKGGLVLDPFVGTGTTLAVAHKLGCRWIGFELNPEYCELIEKRMRPLVAQGALWDPVDEGE